MNRLVFVAGSASLMACSASLRRPLSTTEAVTRLEQVTHTTMNEFDPAVSPDASAIAYEVAASPDALPHVEVMSLKDVGSGKAATAKYSSNETMGLEPAWIPDGSGVLFVSKRRD